VWRCDPALEELAHGQERRRLPEGSMLDELRRKLASSRLGVLPRSVK